MKNNLERICRSKHIFKAYLQTKELCLELLAYYAFRLNFKQNPMPTILISYDTTSLSKEGCLFPMVLVLPHVEFGRNDYREDAPHFS